MKLAVDIMDKHDHSYKVDHEYLPKETKITMYQPFLS